MHFAKVFLLLSLAPFLSAGAFDFIQSTQNCFGSFRNFFNKVAGDCKEKWKNTPGEVVPGKKKDDGISFDFWMGPQALECSRKAFENEEHLSDILNKCLDMLKRLQLKEAGKCVKSKVKKFCNAYNIANNNNQE